MQRPQKTAKAGYLCEGMLETESNKGVYSVVRLEMERQDGTATALKLLNRRVPNGTHGGVRGRLLN